MGVLFGGGGGGGGYPRGAARPRGEPVVHPLPPQILLPSLPHCNRLQTHNRNELN